MFQVADVAKPILAVDTLTALGNQVLFHKGGGTITNLKTGKKIKPIVMYDEFIGYRIVHGQAISRGMRIVAVADTHSETDKFSVKETVTDTMSDVTVSPCKCQPGRNSN